MKYLFKITAKIIADNSNLVLYFKDAYKAESKLEHLKNFCSDAVRDVNGCMVANRGQKTED